MIAAVEPLFLRDVEHGGDPGQPGLVASALAGFITAATSTVDVAIYDFRLSDDLAAPVVHALTWAAAQCLRVRMGYDAGKPAAATAAAFAALEADPAPTGTGDWVTTHFAGTGVQVAPIHASPQLMHSKYVVRDAPPANPSWASGGAGSSGFGAPAVWTGSANFTDDAWTRQENNIVTVPSPELAAAYAADFGQLWAARAIRGTGAGNTGTAAVPDPAGGQAGVGWDFAPGDGSSIDTALVAAVDAATERVVLAAMVLTSHTLLAALARAVSRGVPMTGIYDAGQMAPILTQWRSNPADAQVLVNFTNLSLHLAAKHSTPYTPSGPHDFMHNKILVTDDHVATGSYNFSRNAQANAENQLVLSDAALADSYAEYIGTVAAAYTH